MSNFKKKLMYSCKQVQGFMFDYLDNKLASVTKIRFDWHIRKCKGCDSYFKLYQATSNSKEFFNQNPLPDELKEKTISFLEKEGILDCDQDNQKGKI